MVVSSTIQAGLPESYDSSAKTGLLAPELARKALSTLTFDSTDSSPNRLTHRLSGNPDDPGTTGPSVLDVIRGFLGPDLPAGIAPMAFLLIRCSKRDPALSLELAADLPVGRGPSPFPIGTAALIHAAYQYIVGISNGTEINFGGVLRRLITSSSRSNGSRAAIRCLGPRKHAVRFQGNRLIPFQNLDHISLWLNN